jgi:hypothetical protein
MTDYIFPQHLHDVLPSEYREHITSMLSNKERSFYLRMFRDACHPLMPILSVRDFDELGDWSSATMIDTSSSINAMADIGIALSMQHVHATGLASRVLGVHQTNLSQQGSLGGITWPGFEYFVRCRDSMRAVTDFSLQNLQCHTLMIGYLIKGNAFQEAYNLLGITIRKAFIAQLHRAPLGNLTGTEKTTHVQL